MGTFFALNKLFLVTTSGDLVLLDPNTGKIDKTAKLEHQNLTGASALIFPGNAFCLASVEEGIKFYPMKESMVLSEK